MTEHYLSIYAKSFNWAGFFLPKSTYNKCSDLYNFCRTLDNIADNNEKLDKKKKEFSNFKKKFYEKDFSSRIIKNMWLLIDEFTISLKIIEDLFDGIESDIKSKVDLNGRKELLIYSYRVAGTVGFMMAKVLKVNSETALKSAIDLGIAMQLTNIARDVVEDSKCNRRYIDYNYGKIIETVKTADTFYNRSFNSIKFIPVSSRFAILVARRVYREIGYEILKKKDINDYNKAGKIFVTKIGKIKQTILSIVDFFKLIYVKPESHLKVDEHLEINRIINLNERF